jgi:hypothetical protein
MTSPSHRYLCYVRIASMLAVIVAMQQHVRRAVAVTVERLSSNIGNIDGDNRSSCGNAVVPDNEHEPKEKEAANKCSGRSLMPATPTVQKYLVPLRTTDRNIYPSKSCRATNKCSGRSLTPATPTVQKYLVPLRTTNRNIYPSKSCHNNTRYSDS